MRTDRFQPRPLQLLRLLWRPFAVAACVICAIAVCVWIFGPTCVWRPPRARDLLISVDADLEVLAYAAEVQYRRTGEWPEDTHTLHRSPFIHPNNPYYDPFLAEADFYRIKEVESGIVLYSVGPDRTDDGGSRPYDPSNGIESGGDIIHLVPVPK